VRKKSHKYGANGRTSSCTGLLPVKQFLSESKWDYKQVKNKTALETSALLESCRIKSGKPTGYIIDERSHLKKGKKSVNVSGQ